MKVSVVILNWNGEKFLRKFLPVIVENSTCQDVEIVVADNASTDLSINFIQTEFPQIKTIVFEKNLGFAEGYNQALRDLNSEYFILLNSDVEVSKSWLLPLIDFMDNNKDVAACQPKVLSYTNREYFEHAGAAGGFIDLLGYPFCRGRVFGTVEKDSGQYDNITDIFWATGACLMIRAEIFKSVGGLDGEFFAHMEEIDLCWRLRSRNMRIVCIPQSEVYHVGGGALNVEHPHKTYLNFRNNLLLIYKNMQSQQLKDVLFYRFFLDYIAAMQLLLSGKPANARSVLKARIDFKRMKKSFIKKRNENILFATNLHINEIHPKSIIMDYYLRKKKTFDKIIKR